MFKFLKAIFSRKEKSRKLASIQKITSLEPIDGADRILLAQVLGWQVIVRKGEFSVGDRCVFFEIDSILPDGQKWSEFMRERKFRVKTQKMRGVLSQGLALPLSEVGIDFKIGTDVTQKLKVKKWEYLDAISQGPNRVKQISADTAGPFPHWVSKTDETRIQSAMKALKELNGHPYYISLKYDGQSGTFANYHGKLYVCTRNREIKEGDSNWWQVARKYNLAELPDGYAIQAEVCGPGIQRNLLVLPELEMFVFNVWNIEKKEFLNYGDLVLFCAANDLPMVKILGAGPHFDYSLDELIQAAKGRYESGKHREGIVIRPQVEMKSRALQGRLSFKTINNDFLLKYE